MYWLILTASSISRGMFNKPESHVLIFLLSLSFSFSLSQIILDSFLYRINNMWNNHSLLLKKNYHVDYCICQGGERWELVFPETEMGIDPRSLLFWGNELTIEVFYKKEWVDMTSSLTMLERRLSYFVSVKQLVPELIKSYFLWIYLFVSDWLWSLWKYNLWLKLFLWLGHVY